MEYSKLFATRAREWEQHNKLEAAFAVISTAFLRTILFHFPLHFPLSAADARIIDYADSVKC